MLSKVSSNTVTIPTITETTTARKTKYVEQTGGYQLFYETNFNKKGNYSISIKPSHAYYKMKILVNNEVFFEDESSIQDKNERVFDLWELTNFNLKIYYWTQIQYETITLDITITYTLDKVYKIGKKIYIYTIKAIGTLLNGILFGMLPNGTRRDGN